MLPMALPNLINNIESLQKELIALQPLPVEQQQKLDKKFRLEFNYNSNHIEGNTLTYNETELYLVFDKTTGDHEGREYEEMKASDVALKLVQELATDTERPLTEAFIKNLNQVILVRPYWADAITQDGQPTRRQIVPGDYKKFPNSVKLQNGEMFHYASPQETPALMADLVQWYREELEKKELHPVSLAALLHYRFVRIHPFDDGNGRISRLLMNYVLYYHNLPPIIVKSSDKKNYLTALNKADSGDLNAFVEYIAGQITWSLELSIKAAKGEEIEERDDIEKEIALWKKELKNRNMVDAIPKSAEIVRKLYLENFASFFQIFDEKLVTLFGDLFMGWEVYGLVNRNTRFHIISDMSSVYPPFLEMDSISIIADMNGLKKIESRDVHLNIVLEIFFYPDHYQLQVHTPLGIKKYLTDGRPYNQQINKEEQEMIINDTVKSIFTYLQYNTKL